jgi:hypothetical protein
MTPRHRPMPSKIEERKISFTGARLRERALVAFSTRINNDTKGWMGIFVICREIRRTYCIQQLPFFIPTMQA